MRAALWLAFAGACSYSPARVGGGDPIGDDAPIGTDATSSAACFGTFETVCLERLPTTDFALGGAANLLTTDLTDMCEPTTLDTTVTACVLAGKSIVIDGSLTAVGARPLVLLATEGAITIAPDALVDVASHRNANARGAGANPAGLCLGQVAPTGKAGGAGGSFGGRGGNGGADNGAGAGIAGPIADLSTLHLRGGCPGGLGGNAAGALDGGDGGGAVLLIAPSITVAGTINASGEGALGGSGQGTTPRGGAGGGSGGMIVFDTQTLTIGGTGIAIAQGGGGGEGNDNDDGGPGADPDPNAPGQAAPGGSGGGGQNGGDGGTTGNGEVGDNGATTSAGGGGGGTGVIRILATSSSVAGRVVP